MSQKNSTIYPIEALNIDNPKFEESRKQNYDFFKAKSKNLFNKILHNKT